MGHYEYLALPLDFGPMPVQYFRPWWMTRGKRREEDFIKADKIFFFRSCEKHIHLVQYILQHFLLNSLFVKAEKYKFHASSVSFLELIISQGDDINIQKWFLL